MPLEEKVDMFDQAYTLQLNVFWFSTEDHIFYHSQILNRSLPQAQRALSRAQDKMQLLNSDNADCTQLLQSPNSDFRIAADFRAAK